MTFEAREPKPRSVEELRAIDRRAKDLYGLPGLLLMENAGAGAARIALEMLDEIDASHDSTTLILCGGGGNGGDGYVVARHLALARRRVLVCHASSVSRGDAVVMRDAVVRMGLDELDLSAEGALEQFLDSGRGGQIRRGEESCSLVVDALLGTGARSQPQGVISDLLRFSHSLFLDRKTSTKTGVSEPLLGLALDLPSGLDADLGLSLGGPVFRADRTVSFAARKLGFAIRSSRAWTGRVQICSIGAPS